MDSASILRQTRLFEVMPQEELQKLAALTRSGRYRQGDEICREGSADHEIYVVVLGSVRASKRTAEGGEEDIATIGSGSYFGEMSIATPDHKRTASIRALEDTEVLALPGDAITALAEKDPRFGCAFYSALARGLAQRMRASASDVALLKSLARHR